MRWKRSKTAILRDLLRVHPDWDRKQLAEASGLPVNSVSVLRARLNRDPTGKPKNKTVKNRPVPDKKEPMKKRVAPKPRAPDARVFSKHTTWRYGYYEL